MCRVQCCLAFLIVILGVAGTGRAGFQDDPACVLYFSFDDFRDVVPDDSGHGHEATVHGDVAPAADKGHRAGEFQGIRGPTGLSYLDLQGANFPAEEIPRSAITLAAWVKCKSTGDHHAIFNMRAADATWVMHPEIRSENNFRWLLRAAGGVTIFDIRAGTVAWDEWTLYTGTYDKAVAKATLYINGEVASQQTIADAREIVGDWGSGARVGINVDNARPFTGLMDELYLFKRALTQAEVKQLLVIPAQLKAYAPKPADGAKEVMMPLLQWTAGDRAVLHDVYVGTSPDLGPADLVAPRTAMAIFWVPPASVTPGTTYYWRVDEIEADGTTVHQGDVWSFTTAVLTASEPRPRDGSQWVSVDADLEWTTGTGALSHDVYFGTDRAAVEAAAPDAFKGNQLAVSYDPGSLAQNTTYYWRVDEHGEKDVLQQGAVWSFTTIGPGAGVEAQYFKGASLAGAPLLTQVEDSINHNWGEAAVAAGVADDVSARWTADLEAPFTETYELITTSDDGVRLWLDGRLVIDDWRSHGSTDDIVKVDLVAGQTYSLVMEWYDNSGSAIAKLWWQSPSIRREIIPAGPLQLPVRATGPSPLNSAANVAQDFVLRWTAGSSATGHDVYFGDDKDAVAGATPASMDVYRGRQALEETTYDPGVLEWNKTCYWRIDEVNDAHPDSPWKGNVWTFTTANFIVVDDFESYTDEEGRGSRIYETWEDGWSDGSSGSQVGYINPPFAEQRLVHSGRQSMPLDYNNVNSPYYSEAQRAWDKPQDWTTNGVDTLTLHIRGKTANAPGPLYVTVEDSTGHVGTAICPDPAILTTATWTQWQIPLSDLSAAGVKVTAVKKIYIGIGNREAPTPGGHGMVFIDDIWVTKAP